MSECDGVLMPMATDHTGHDFTRGHFKNKNSVTRELCAWNIFLNVKVLQMIVISFTFLRFNAL